MSRSCACRERSVAERSAAGQAPLLFESLPEAPIPVSEASDEWRDAQLLRLVEGIRYDPARLARYMADNADGLGFLDFMIERLGGRSQ